MLALAHRIASYVGEERAARRQPIFNLTLPNMAPPERDASQVRALSSFVFAENTRPEQGRRAFFPRRTVPTPALFPFPAGFALSSSLEGEGMARAAHITPNVNVTLVSSIQYRCYFKWEKIGGWVPTATAGFDVLTGVV